MMLRLIAGALLLAAAIFLPAVSALSLDIRRQGEVVRDTDKCFDGPSGRQRTPNRQIQRPYLLGQKEEPLAQSMDNFISLVEKIEEHPRSKRVNAESMARGLLSRFRIDSVTRNPITGGFVQDQNAVIQNQIEDILLGGGPMGDSYDFDEESLEQGERCSMYFMLSHEVNAQALTGDQSVYRSPARQQANGRRQNGQRNNGGSIQAAPTMLTNRPREHGVVSHRNDLREAIALNKVLLGLVAALGQSPPKSVDQVLQEMNSFSPQQQQQQQPGNNNNNNNNNNNDQNTGRQSGRNGQIDPLLGVTLGPTVAIGSILDASGAGGQRQSGNGNNNPSEFGATGEWNSTVCTTEYRLSTKDGTLGTLAEIRGGLDGYNMGRLIRGSQSTFAELKLSQILRMYYSPMGFRPESTEGSVCSRSLARQSLNQVLKEQGKSYLSVFSEVKFQGPVPTPVDQLIELPFRAFLGQLNVVSEHRMEPDWCQSVDGMQGGGGGRAGQGRMAAYRCDTPTDVLAMVDTGGELKEMMAILQGVGLSLNMRKWSSSMSILGNSLMAGGQLQQIAWNTTNRGCALCKLAFSDFRMSGMPIRGADKLMEHINGTLREYEKGQLERGAVPSKNFMVFNYGQLKVPRNGDRSRFDRQAFELKQNHRETALLFLGRALEKDLLEFTWSKNQVDDVFVTEGQEVGQVVERLRARMCETPASFQYAECAQSPSSEVAIEGFVTPDTLQRWAFQPRYFLKSYRIQIRFTANSDALEVCMGRQPKPEESTNNCKEVKGGTGEMTDMWAIRNPCRGRNLATCDPIYITIVGKRDQATTQRIVCKEPKCANLEQIKYTMTHTGISCNGAGRVANSVWAQLSLVFVAMFLGHRLTNGKY